MHQNYYAVVKYPYVPFLFAVWNIRSLVLFNLLIFNIAKLLEGWQLEFMSLDSKSKKNVNILKRQVSVATDKYIVTLSKPSRCVSIQLVYRVSQEECAKLREGVPCVKVYRFNPKHLCPKLNSYGDNGQRSLKLWQLYILKLAVICGFCNVNICT